MKDQITAQVVQLLLPLAGTLVLAAGAWLSASIRKSIKNTNVLKLITRVERFSELVVQELNQTIVEASKAANDGKLSKDEVVLIQTQALARVKTLLGDKGLKELQGAVGDVHTLIKTTLEAKVRELKPSLSGVLMARRDL